MTLRAVSYLAPNWFGFYQTLTGFLEQALHVNIGLTQGVCDPLVDPLLLGDRVDLTFICGLPLVRSQQITPGLLRPIVAPVLQSDRYQNRPVYFSDVIVHAQRPYQHLRDLVGKTACYNDRGSNSGYYLLCFRLLQENIPAPTFSSFLPSGSHQQSIRWVADGRVDCAAIDSTVLEEELRQFPELAGRLRVVETIGPYPIPPIAVSTRLGKPLIAQLRAALLQPTAALQAAMHQQGISHYAAVTNQDYEIIAQIYHQVVQSGYPL